MIREILILRTDCGLGENDPSFHDIEIADYNFNDPRMGMPTLTATIMHPMCLDKEWTQKEYVVLRGERYYIRDTPTSSETNNEIQYKHELNFKSEREILGEILFADKVPYYSATYDKPCSNSQIFLFYGTIEEALDRLNSAFLAAGVGDSILYEKTTLRDSDIDNIVGDGYCAVLCDNGDYDYSTVAELSFTDKYIWEVFSEYYEKFKVPFKFNGKTMLWGAKRKMLPHVLKYGHDDALLSVTKTNANAKIVNRVTFRGSSENIPYYYPNESEYGNIALDVTPTNKTLSLSDLSIDNMSVLLARLNADNKAVLKKNTMIETETWPWGANLFMYQAGNGTIVTPSKPTTGSTTGNRQQTKYPITASDGKFTMVMYVRVVQDGEAQISLKGGIWQKNKTAVISAKYKEEVLEPSGNLFSSELCKSITARNWGENRPVNEYKGDVIDLMPHRENGLIEYANFTKGNWEIICEFEIPVKWLITKESWLTVSEWNFKEVDTQYLYWAIGDRRYRSFGELGVKSQKELSEDMLGDSFGWKAISRLPFQTYLCPPKYRNTAGAESFYNAINDYYLNDAQTYVESLNLSTGSQYPMEFDHYGEITQLYCHIDKADIPLGVPDIIVSIPNDAGTEKGVEYRINRNSLNADGSVGFYLYPKQPTGRHYLTFRYAPDSSGSNHPISTFKNIRLTDKPIEYLHFANPFIEGLPREHIYVDETIKPTIEGIRNGSHELLGSIAGIAYDSDDNDSLSADATQESDTNDSLKYEHSYFYIKLNKFDGKNGFDLFKSASQSDPMTIQMTSGKCNGCKFKIQAITKNNDAGLHYFENPVQTTGKGSNIVAGSYKDKVKKNEPQEWQQNTMTDEIWIAVLKDSETFGVVMPNREHNYLPSVGDTFNIININLPESYIIAAEKRGEDAMLKFMAENNEEKFNFSITCSRIFFAENPHILAELDSDSDVTVEYDGEQYPLSLSSYSITSKSDEPLPEIKLELTDAIFTPSSSLSQIVETAINVKVGRKSFGGGNNDEIDRRFNELYALIAEMKAENDTKYLSKTESDRSVGSISSDSAVEVGKFTSGLTGGKMYIDEETGLSLLEVDVVKARMKAYFDTVVVSETESISGEELITPGGGLTISFVDDIRDENYTLQGWRCYYQTDNLESAITPLFKVDDFAYSKAFNLDSTTSTGESRFFWRRVTAVGDSYIELSAADCADHSDTPMPGDSVCQLGNLNDKARQAAIILSTTDSYAPSITLYQNIDTYTLANRDIVSYGYDKTRKKAFFKVFGDGFIGARDRSSYMEYTEEKGLVVKGNISVESVVGDKKIDKFVDDKVSSAKNELQQNINELQKQVDGVIETFSGMVDPSTTNAPANGWNTDAERQKHIGDVYFNLGAFDESDNPNAGHAWRWYYNSSSDYGWTEIADSDAVRALQLAKMSVLDADVLYKQTNSQTTTPEIPTVNSSGTITDLKGWATTAPAWKDGMYIWQTTYVKKGDGSASFSDPTCISGRNGIDAKAVEINGEQVFTYSNDFSSDANPSSITLTAALQNTTGYQWSYKRSDQSAFSDISGATASTLVVAAASTVYFPSGIKSCTFRCTSNGVHDEITIVKVSSGTNGESVVTLVRPDYFPYKVPLAEWQKYATWNNNDWLADNFDDVKIGDLAIVRGIVTDRDNTDCYLTGIVVSKDPETRRVYLDHTRGSFVFGNPGDDAYTVILSNESHVFKGDATNALASSTSSDIVAYKGADRIAATISSITGMPTGMKVSIANNGTVNAKFTVAVTTSLTEKQGTLTIPITVDGKTFNRTFSWSLSLDGRGITSTKELYAVNNDSSKAPADSDFSESVPQTSITNRYLWNYEVTSYSDGSTKPTQKRVIGVHGANGEAGASIEKVENYYLASSSASGVTTSTTGWTTNASSPAATVNADKPYLWNYEKITYSKGDPTTTEPHVVGRYGKDGITPRLTEEYYLSSSKTQLVGGAWTSKKPEWKAGYYYWTRTKVDYGNDDVEYTDPICVTADDGTSVLAQYSADAVSWHPSFVSGDIWMRTSSDGGKTWTAAIRIVGQTGANGKDGADGPWRKFQWAKNNSSATAPTAGWQDTPMTANAGEYVWMRSGMVTPPATDPASWSSATRLTGDRGTDGESVYSLDLSNEVAGIACDANGTVTGSYPTSKASVYKGSSLISSGITYSIAQAVGATASINASGDITVSGISADTATVVVQAVVNSVTLQTTFNLYKVKSGASVSITSQAVTYQQGSSGTIIPTGAWSAAIPSVPAGHFLWTRTIVSYSDGTSTTSYGVSRIGTNGNDGKDGKDGVGIKSSEVRYAKGNYPTQPADSLFTLTSIGTLSPGEYLWTRTIITYTDSPTNTSKSYSVSRIGSDGAKGLPGAPGADGRTTYVHFVYASGITGSLPHPTTVTDFNVTAFAGAKYIGVCTDYNSSDSTDFSVYEWSEYKGTDATVYSLLPSVTSIIKSTTGSLSVNSVNCRVFKTTGDSGAILTGEKELRFTRLPDGASGTLTHTSGLSTNVTVLETTEAIVFELYDGTTVIDRERVPVLSDASDLELSARNLLLNSKEFTVTAGTTNYSFITFNLPIPLKAGDYVALMVEGIQNLAGSPTSYSCGVYDKTISNNISGGNNVLTATNRTTVFQITKDEAEPRFIFYSGVAGQTAGNSVKYTKAILVKGNMPMQTWSPAPEDTTTEIAAVRSETQTSLQTLENKIELKVSRTDYDDNNNKINQRISSIQTTANNISLQVNRGLGWKNLLPNGATGVGWTLHSIVSDTSTDDDGFNIHVSGEGSTIFYVDYVYLSAGYYTWGHDGTVTGTVGLYNMENLDSTVIWSFAGGIPDDDPDYNEFSYKTTFRIAKDGYYRLSMGFPGYDSGSSGIMYKMVLVAGRSLPESYDPVGAGVQGAGIDINHEMIRLRAERTVIESPTGKTVAAFESDGSFNTNQINADKLNIHKVIAYDSEGNKIASMNEDGSGAYKIFWPGGAIPRLILSPTENNGVIQYYNDQGVMLWWIGANMQFNGAGTVVEKFASVDFYAETGSASSDGDIWTNKPLTKNITLYQCTAGLSNKIGKYFTNADLLTPYSGTVWDLRVIMKPTSPDINDGIGYQRRKLVITNGEAKISYVNIL